MHSHSVLTDILVCLEICSDNLHMVQLMLFVCIILKSSGFAFLCQLIMILLPLYECSVCECFLHLQSFTVKIMHLFTLLCF